MRKNFKKKMKAKIIQIRYDFSEIISGYEKKLTQFRNVFSEIISKVRT